MNGPVIGIDIGGTFIKGVVIEEDKTVYKTSIETNDHHDRWKQNTAQILKELISQAQTDKIVVGLSAPGISDAANRSIVCMPGRLDGLEYLDWSNYLKQDVHVLNDAHAALFAESRWGAAKGIPNAIMLTLGTGVGGGLLINGELVQGYLQRAGHFGHIAVDSGKDSRSITGITGSLEGEVGEATLSERSLNKFKTSKDLVNAVVSGDTWASYIWLTSVRKLALGIVSLCNGISPEVIILGGGITKAGEHLMKPLSTFMDLYEWRPNDKATPIRIAALQEFAGAIGAALFARSRLGPP